MPPAMAGGRRNSADSFSAATPVLMAGGGVKPIAKIAVGDKVVKAVPGQGVGARFIRSSG